MRQEIKSSFTTEFSRVRPNGKKCTEHCENVTIHYIAYSNDEVDICKVLFEGKDVWPLFQAMELEDFIKERAEEDATTLDFKDGDSDCDHVDAHRDDFFETLADLTRPY